MKNSWGTWVFFCVLSAFLGAFGAIGFYEVVRPAVLHDANPLQPLSRQDLFSLAIVGMYLVALLIAATSLSFAVFGKQWVESLVSRKTEHELRQLEIRSNSRVYLRMAYILWQLSKGDDQERTKYLDEAIELTRKCYEDRFDPNDDIKANEVNNLAYFLIERGEDADKSEAVELSDTLLEIYKKFTERNACLCTYAEIVLTCHSEFSDPKAAIKKAIKLVSPIANKSKSQTEIEEAKRLSVELNKKLKNLTP